MTYTINNTTLTNLFKEEVSRVAGSAYSEGASLYDSVAVHSRDNDTVSRLFKDSIDAVVRRTADICTYIPSPLSLSLYAPDMDTTKVGVVSDELDRAISMGAVAGWLKEKLPGRAQEYYDRANLALDNAVSILKTRKQITLS